MTFGDPASTKNRFSFIIPSALAILAFVISIFFFFLPRVREIGINQKKGSITELVKLPLEICSWYDSRVNSGEMREEDARQSAANLIRNLRYGDRDKDYFWIVDTGPTLIMHPYRGDLQGHDVSDYKDEDGTLVFMEMVRIVREQGAGFVTYHWQLRDEAEKIEEKLSYVAYFEPWQWIIGSGIYLGEASREFAAVTRSMMAVSIGVSVFIGIVLIFLTRRGIRVQREWLKSEEQYRSLVEAMHEGIAGQDTEGRFTYVNRQFCMMIGYTNRELIGKKVTDFIAEDSREAFREEMKKRRSGEEPIYTSEWETKGGSRLVTLVSPRIQYDAEGKQTGSFAVVTDITKLKRVEDELRSLLQEKTVLLREVHHRVKNNLQLISSLFSLQYRDIHDETARNMLYDSQARIQTMSRIHEFLYQSDNFREIGMQNFLDQLIFDIKAVYVEAEKGGVDFTTRVDDVILTVDRAIPCGLIMNELVSNAVKHAFPAERVVPDRNMVSLFLKAENASIVFGVEDNGKGLPEDFSVEEQTTLGMELITILCEQLNGEFRFDAKKNKPGCKIEICIPRE